MKTKILAALLALAVASEAGSAPARIVNISCLAGIRRSENAILGFTISGTQPRQLLMRAVGPGLRPFGISDFLADPRFELNGRLYDDWAPSQQPAELAAIGRVGAFPIATASVDAVALVPVQPGSATPIVRNIGRDFGRVLLEVYDAETNSAANSAITNLSIRKAVDSDTNNLVVGFVIEGDGEVGVLLRVAGPALRRLGLTGYLEDPNLVVHREGVQIYANDDFAVQANGADINAVSQRVGAFSFAPVDPKLDTGKDAAAFLTLTRGAYTLTVNPRAPVNEARFGEVLAELYLVPAAK